MRLNCSRLTENWDILAKWHMHISVVMVDAIHKVHPLNFIDFWTERTYFQMITTPSKTFATVAYLSKFIVYRI